MCVHAIKYQLYTIITLFFKCRISNIKKCLYTGYNNFTYCYTFIFSLFKLRYYNPERLHHFKKYIYGAPDFLWKTRCTLRYFLHVMPIISCWKFYYFFICGYIIINTVLTVLCVQCYQVWRDTFFLLHVVVKTSGKCITLFVEILFISGTLKVTCNTIK